MAKAPLAQVGQLEDIQLELEWQPFELRPEPAPLLDPKSDYVQRSWRQSVEPLSRKLGVEIRFPTVLPRTRLAHEATEFARQAGKATPMVEGIFKAFYQDGLDIGSVDTLVSLGQAVGLDSSALRQALDQRTLKPQVDERLELAKQMNITAVPTFIVGERYLLRGLVSVDQLVEATRLVQSGG